MNNIGNHSFEISLIIHIKKYDLKTV